MNPSPVDCITELLAYTYHLTEHLRIEDPAYEQVSANYQRLIQRARARAKAAGIPVSRFDEALFAIFAWIDEAILETPWAQRENWVRHSLQKQYFNTTSAGEEFYTRLAKLTPDDKDLLEVFDYCLASGFKGCLFETYHQEKRQTIQSDTRKKLIDGPVVDDPPDILFPEAGDVSQTHRLKRKKWKGLSGSSSLFVLVPILVFLALYYLMDLRLNHLLDAGRFFK